MKTTQYSTPAHASAPFVPFLWPDRVIGKRESRAIREQQNALFNSHAELLAALEYAVNWAEGFERVSVQKVDWATQARAAIAHAKGTP